MIDKLLSPEDFKIEVEELITDAYTEGQGLAPSAPDPSTLLDHNEAMEAKISTLQEALKDMMLAFACGKYGGTHKVLTFVEAAGAYFAGLDNDAIGIDDCDALLDNLREKYDAITKGKP